jgi:hypothetical protein
MIIGRFDQIGGLELWWEGGGNLDGKTHPHVGNMTDRPRLQLLVREEAVDLLLNY